MGPYTIILGVAYEYRNGVRLRVRLTIADLIWQSGKWLGGVLPTFGDLRGIGTRWRLFGKYKRRRNHG